VTHLNAETLAELLAKLTAMGGAPRLFGAATAPSLEPWLRKELERGKATHMAGVHLGVPVLVDRRMEAAPTKIFLYDSLEEWLERIREQQQWEDERIIAYTLRGGGHVDKRDAATWLNWYPWHLFKPGNPTLPKA